MPVESRHFLLNAHVAGRVLVLCQIAAKSLIEEADSHGRVGRLLGHVLLVLNWQCPATEALRGRSAFDSRRPAASARACLVL